MQYIKVTGGQQGKKQQWNSLLILYFGPRDLTETHNEQGASELFTVDA